MNKKNKVKVRRYRGYAIAEDGRVFKNGKELKGYVDNNYLRFGYEENRFYLHRIMLPLFLNINVEGLDVHHIDGNKLNNSLDNLVALTKSEHMAIHNKTRSPETLEKIRQACLGRSPNEETRKKLSEALKGRKKSEEHRAKIAENNRMRNNKKVIMNVNGREATFNSIKEAEEKTGIKGISRAARGVNRTAGKIATPCGEKIKVKWRYANE